jgi:hypothetical protein
MIFRYLFKKRTMITMSKYERKNDSLLLLVHERQQQQQQQQQQNSFKYIYNDVINLDNYMSDYNNKKKKKKKKKNDYISVSMLDDDLSS